MRTLAPGVEVLILVDVLSFTTAVDVAAARGALVYPYIGMGEAARSFAAEQGALLAVRRETSQEQPYSLSPCSLLSIPRGTRIVLPSLNGSRLSALASKTHPVAAGCLRNARAVAAWARARGTVGVIAAGEVRRVDGTLRFALEDLLGAGAILSHFPAEARSPEANAAVAAFDYFAADLSRQLARCASGRELAAIGYAEDVVLAAQLDASASVPVLIDEGMYVAR
jgi:2-phosphosulfolactate phosphatase